MPQYLTGATATRTLEVAISFTDSGGTYTTEGAIVLGSLGILWTTSWSDIGGGGVEPPPLAPPPPTPTPTGRRVVLTISMGTLGSGTWTIDNPATLAGTATITIPTREILDLGYIPGVSVGGIVIDPELPWGARAREYRNGTATLSATILGQTLTRTSASDATRLLPFWTMRSKVASAFGNIGGGTQALSPTTLPSSGTTGAPTSSVSKSGTVSSGGYSYSYTNTASAGNSGASASLVISGTGNHPNAVAEASATLEPARTATINGALYLMSAAYPDAIQAKSTTTGAWESVSSGAFTLSVDQRQYDTWATVHDHTNVSFGTLSQRQRISGQKQSVYPWVKFTRDGASYEQAMRLYGPKWNPISLLKTDQLVFDDGSTLAPSGTWGGTWSAGGGGSVSIDSGAVKLTGASGKTLTRTITGGGNLQGYSRLRIRLRCSAASHTITVATSANSAGIIGNRWSVTTGAAGAWTNLYVDLSAQTNGYEVSVWDTNYQVAAPGSYQRLYFGGGLLILQDLGAGTYEIDEVEALMAPSSGSLINLFPGARKLVGIGDGQTTLDQSLGNATLGTVGTTLAQLVAALGTSWAGAGWSASDNTPPTSPVPAEPLAASEIIKSNHPGVMLGGDGLLWDDLSETWSLPFSADGVGAYSPGNLPAQWLVWECAWDWPETTLGGFRSSSGVLGAGLSLGRSFWGRILQATDTQTPGDATAPAGKDPAASVSVSLQSLAGVTLATTTTDSKGWFALPALASLQGVARLVVAGRTGFVEKPLHDVRSRLVVVVSAPPDGTLLAMAVSATGRVVRAYRDTDNTLLLEFWRRSGGWDSTDTGLTVTGSGALCYDRQSNLQRLWLAIEDSGAVKSRYTDDEGGTWSTMTTIFSSGTNPAVCISPTGVRHYFCVSGSAIKTKALDPEGNVVIAESTVVASGVAASAIDAVHDGKLLLLTYRNTSNAVVTVISTDGGATFS